MPDIILSVEKISNFDFIDFGASKGESIEFSKSHLGGKNGIGIDMDPQKVKALRQHGYDSVEGDITRLSFPPKCVRFVTMSHFLEHLPNLSLIEKVIEKAAEVSSDFLFIRGPYFDADHYLHSLGYKLYWSDWTGHKVHLTTSELSGLLFKLGLRDFNMMLRGKIENSMDTKIHPLISPPDQHQHIAGKHPPKEMVSFERPVWTELVCYVKLRPLDNWDMITKALPGIPVNIGNQQDQSEAVASQMSGKVSQSQSFAVMTSTSLQNHIVIYTASPSNHALPVLRISGPSKLAGLKIIQGNEWNDISLENISDADLVIIQRDFPRFTDTYKKIYQRAREETKPIVFELDDLLIELPEIHPDRTINYYTRSVIPMLRALLDADLVTASTVPLCNYLRQYNPNTYHLPNFLDDHIWTLCPPVYQSIERPVVIGYMGSTSHVPDLKLVEDVLKQIADRYQQRILFRFWGIQPPVALSDYPNVEYNPAGLMDYREFAQFFSSQECDIFIAPLADNLFNRCKSGIKYLEYSALGVPGVYSRLEPYADIVRDGETGLLASTPEDWMSCLLRLIESPDLRYEIAQNAQEDVKQNWLMSKNAYRWRDVYQRAVELHGKNGVDPMRRKILEQVQYWQVATNEMDLQDLQDVIHQKERRIQELEEYIADLYSSNAWRLIDALWGIRRSWIPMGSRRERMYHWVGKRLRRIPA